MSLEQSINAYQQLRDFFINHNIPYKEIAHEAEGRCDVVSQLRGNELKQVAKAMVIMVKFGKKARKYYLAVVPGNKKVDLQAIQKHVGGSHIMFAPANQAEQLTGCQMGAVPPISFDPELHLLVDPVLLENDEIVFNAGCLDKSFFLSSQAYISLVRPLIIKISV